MNPDGSFRALRFWMTSEEKREMASRRSAASLSVGIALAGSLWVALRWESDPSFLLAHSAAAIVSLGGVAAWGAPWLVAVAQRNWWRWTLQVVWGALLFVAAGLLGVALAGGSLKAMGHARPWGLLANQETPNLLLAAGSSFALALALCGSWALAWRWALRPRAPSGAPPLRR